MGHHLQHVGNLHNLLLKIGSGLDEAFYRVFQFIHTAICCISEGDFVSVALVFKQCNSDALLQAFKLTERAFLPHVEAERAVIVGHDVSPLSLAASPATMGVNAVALTQRAWRIQSSCSL